MELNHDAAAPCTIVTLPNELLLQCLDLLDTPAILPVTAVSHRFHSLVLRILGRRLQSAAALYGHQLVLECYRPAARNTEAPLHCDYLGTDGLEEACQSRAEAEHGFTEPGQQLRALKGLYSRFKPYRRAFEKKRQRHPAGDVPGSRTFAAATATQPRLDADIASSTSTALFVHELTSPEMMDEAEKRPAVTTRVHLDGSELFSQIIAHTHLVKIGPRPGLYTSFVPVSEGVIRIWRRWLAEQIECKEGQAERIEAEAMDAAVKGKDVVKTAGEPYIQDPRGILWTNVGKNVCMRFRVEAAQWNQTLGGGGIETATSRAVLPDDELPVTYELEYEELLVRTTHLLLMTEASRVQAQDKTGKAIVFGSWN